MSTLVKSAVVVGSMMLGSVLVAGQALADDFWFCRGHTEPLRIIDIGYGGTGCPTGSLDFGGIVFSDDQFSILFGEDFIAEQGPGFTRSDRRKNCAVRVLFSVPRGFQFSLAAVEFKGFADLPGGVNGTQEATFDFPLLVPRTKVSKTIPGPSQDNYDQTALVPLPTWSRCGRDEATLAIDSQVFLSGDRFKPAAMTLDTIDGVITQIFSCNIRPCN